MNLPVRFRPDAKREYYEAVDWSEAQRSVSLRPDHKRVFYDLEWNCMNIRYGYKLEPREIKKPESLAKMLSAASILGRDFDFVRIDFYEICDRPYFGEMTFTPEAGLAKFDPPEIDVMLGKMWTSSART